MYASGFKEKFRPLKEAGKYKIFVYFSIEI